MLGVKEKECFLVFVCELYQFTEMGKAGRNTFEYVCGRLWGIQDLSSRNTNFEMSAKHPSGYEVGSWM